MGWLIDIKRRGRVNVDKDSGEVYTVIWLVVHQDDATGKCLPSTAMEVLEQLRPYVDMDSPYDGNPLLLCFDIAPESDEDGEMWEVTTLYKEPDASTPPDDFEEFMERSNGSNANDPNNPFGPEFSGNGMIVEEYRIRDKDNKLIVNSAKQQFRALPPTPVTIQVKRVTVSQAQAADVSQIGKCDGRVLLAAASYTSAIHKSKTGRQTRYYRNTYETWVHPDKDWARIEVQDVGFVIIGEDEDGAPALKEIVDPDTKMSYSQETNLDGDGKPQAVGQPPVYLEFRIRDEGPLSVPFLL